MQCSVYIKRLKSKSFCFNQMSKYRRLAKAELWLNCLVIKNNDTQTWTEYETGLRLCVCLSVCGRISWSIFTKIGTDVKTPKSKNDRQNIQYIRQNLNLPNLEMVTEDMKKEIYGQTVTSRQLFSCHVMWQLKLNDVEIPTDISIV